MTKDATFDNLSNESTFAGLRPKPVEKIKFLKFGFNRHLLENALIDSRFLLQICLERGVSASKDMTLRSAVCWLPNGFGDSV